MDVVRQEAAQEVRNWGEMLIVEPRLAVIDQLLVKLRGRIARGLDRWQAYELVKLELKERVGFLAGTDAVLTDERSYIIGIRHIEKVLEL